MICVFIGSVIPVLDFKKNLDKVNNFQIFIILLFFGFFVYFNAIFHPFVHDDIVFIKKNPFISQLNLKNIFLQTASFEGKSAIINSYYRPVLEVFYRAQYQLFGFNSSGYHLVNIFLHIANSFMIFLLLQFLSKGRKVFAFAASFIFLVHPAQSEAVACISGISNLVFAFFCFLSFYFYLLATQKSKRKNYFVLCCFSLAVFFLALFAKEQAVVLPMLIILFEICNFLFFDNKNSENKVLAEKIVLIVSFFLILTGYFLFRKTVVGSTSADAIIINHEFWLRILAIPQTIIVYLGIVFFPVDLHYYRNIDILQPSLIPAIFLFVLTVFCIFIIRAIPLRRQKGVVIFGIGWFFISIAPVLNIIPIINEYSLILTAEHFLYVPILGLIMSVLGIFSYFIELNPNRKIGGFLVLFCAANMIFGAITIKQNTYWADEVVLFERTVKYEKSFGRGHHLLAKANYFKGNFYAAIKEYKKALEIMQGYAGKVKEGQALKFYLGFIKEIYFDLAHCYEDLGDYKESLENYKKALELDPNDGAMHNNIGVNYANLNNFDKAMEHFKIALDLNKNDSQAINNLAVLHMKIGNIKKAEELFKCLNQKRPN